MAITHFSLRQLEIFAAVMRTGQVRAAATELHLGQAAVSQAVKQLADNLGLDLFERQGRAIHPTRAAHRLLELTREPCAELALLELRLKGDAAPALAGPIHIAASSTVARYYLPARIASVARDHPALRVTLSAGNSAWVEACVAAGDADLGFIEGPARNSGITATQWLTDPLEIIGPPAAPARIEAENLHDWPWILREVGSGTRSVFEERLALAGLHLPAARIVINDNRAIVRTVAAGGGLACISCAAASDDVAAGRIRFMHLGDHSFARPLWAVQHVNRANSPLGATLLEVLDQAGVGPDDAAGTDC